MSGPAIELIVAVAENGVIGAKGGLPWRIGADLRRFRSLTMGKPMIMGRKTFESIGRVLDGRDSIVVTRQSGFAHPGVLAAGSIDAALAIARRRAAERGAEIIPVIGGADIFRATMHMADRLHVTHVEGTLEGDVFLPAIDPSEWTETSRERLPSSEGDTAAAHYTIYRRRR